MKEFRTTLKYAWSIIILCYFQPLFHGNQPFFHPISIPFPWNDYSQPPWTQGPWFSQVQSRGNEAVDIAASICPTAGLGQSRGTRNPPSPWRRYRGDAKIWGEILSYRCYIAGLQLGFFQSKKPASKTYFFPIRVCEKISSGAKQRGPKVAWILHANCLVNL